MEILKVEDLSFYYDNERVLNKVSFSINQGEFVILTGENGTAKSTLVKNIIGLLKPHSGRVQMASHNEKGDKLSIGYVAQNMNALNAGFPSTVQEFVESGRFSKNRWFKRLDDQDLEHVAKAIDAVGMTHLKLRMIGELSGGQKQRVMLARVFALDPDFYVLDEPTNGMDNQSRQSFYKLLKHLSRDHGKTILMVSHEDAELEGIYDREIRLYREEGSPWKCFNMTSSKEHSSLV